MMKCFMIYNMIKIYNWGILTLLLPPYMLFTSCKLRTWFDLAIIESWVQNGSYPHDML